MGYRFRTVVSPSQPRELTAVSPLLARLKFLAISLSICFFELPLSPKRPTETWNSTRSRRSTTNRSLRKSSCHPPPTTPPPLTSRLRIRCLAGLILSLPGYLSSELCKKPSFPFFFFFFSLAPYPQPPPVACADRCWVRALGKTARDEMVGV